MGLPAYSLRGSVAQRLDTKLMRWARSLGRYQDSASGDYHYNPRKTDTQKRILWKLASTMNESRTTVQAGVTFGQGVPNFTPIGKKKIFVQTNSNPPFSVWIYYSLAWLELSEL